MTATTSTCSICGVVAHMAKDCPQLCPCVDVTSYNYSMHTRDKHYCYTCKTSGFSHLPANCAQKCACGKDGCQMGQHRCGTCHSIGEYEHDEQKCPHECPCKTDGIHSRERHYCQSCKKQGFQHYLPGCPELCPCTEMSDIRGVFGTAERYFPTVHTAKNHFCKFCQTKGFQHFFFDCPELCPCVKAHGPLYDTPGIEYHSRSDCQLVSS